MSVLVKGMEMPKHCNECGYRMGCYGLKPSVMDYYGDKRPCDCPLIELHDHGDLIDRNMLVGGFADWYIQESPMYLGDNKVVAETIGDAMKAIEDAPVVIRAERSEDGET